MPGKERKKPGEGEEEADLGATPEDGGGGAGPARAVAGAAVAGRRRGAGSGVEPRWHRQRRTAARAVEDGGAGRPAVAAELGSRGPLLGLPGRRRRRAGSRARRMRH